MLAVVQTFYAFVFDSFKYFFTLEALPMLECYFFDTNIFKALWYKYFINPDEILFSWISETCIEILNVITMSSKKRHIFSSRSNNNIEQRETKLSCSIFVINRWTFGNNPTKNFVND